MGSKFFAKTPTISVPGTNMEARAINSNAYAGHAASGAANKDIAAAMALYKAHGMKPTVHDAAANAPGPKRT